MELEICFAVPVSINISPLAGLESLKLIREGRKLVEKLYTIQIVGQKTINPPLLFAFSH